IIQWNLAAQSETGISPERAYQKKLTQIFPRLEADMRKISDAISLGKESSQRKRMYIKNQVTLYEDITIYPLISGTEAGAGAVIRFDNVTEQVMISEMMIQSEKMLSLGGLAAGMAHEINNPLAGMMQTANVVLNRLGNHDVIASTQLAAELGTDLATINQYMERRGIVVMLNNIIASGHRIALIVDNMLDFSRQNQALSAEHSIIHLLNQALELSMTDHSLKHHYDFKNIVIVKEYQLDLPLINCEAGKIQQVFLNLLRNAAQAMQEDGVHKPQLILRINYDDKLKQVMIEIEDNGPGINDEVKLRVFDPFFTTKSEGLGTGLGLSVSYFIITENHGGKLTVDSVVGEYTKFIICLPLTGKKAP
ncbi:MAG: PAS domain-containing sensor histidine kinase, partial [Oceanospirillaceae bacterium]|nr:PAS domain-containing sensor histidine kinase [Oceanospirillaceae bacterium]